MVRKFAIALAAGAVVAGGILTPTDASAWCRCGYTATYWYPAYRPVYATYAAPVLVRRPVTTYAYTWTYQPYRYAYYAPVWRPRVVAFGW